MQNLLKKFKVEYLFIGILLVGSCFLRFYDLGYYDYIGDEHKAFIEIPTGQNLLQFFMSQRKGPMQFLVSYIPYFFTHDFRNELAERIPFSIISVLAVLSFYFLTKKLTKNSTAGFFSAFLLMVNGFIAGFGRIAQYQNLNLLFNFLSLYFYADLLFNNKKLIRSTLMGTFFFCLSLLSHWDAVFIMPLIIYIFFKFLTDSRFEKKYKIRIILLNFVLGCLLILPFLLPYVFSQTNSSDNMRYLSRRMGFGESDRNLYKLYIDLYNPFLTFWFLAASLVLSLIFIKKLWIYHVWFLIVFIIFDLFFRKPGTHIYNFVIPVLILSGAFFAYLIDYFPKILKYLVISLLGLCLIFFYFQTYMVFIDHSEEYPWSQKEIVNLTYTPKKVYGKPQKPPFKILYLKTPKYTIEQKLPLFGFPHSRKWNEINDFINKKVEENPICNGYVTNEDKTVSEWYIDANYELDGCFYVIGVRRPVNFVEDWNVTNIGSKTEIHSIEVNGNKVVKIFISGN